jgi:hypothetical protein
VPSPCPHHRARSPENPDCAWCERYRLNLDPGGRLCAACAAEPDLRRRLEALGRVRDDADCAHGTWCERFLTPATPQLCRRCREDPALRALLHGQAEARRRVERHRRLARCRHRGAPLREIERPCCGGRRARAIVYACRRRGEALPERCQACPDWAPRAAAGPVPDAPEEPPHA